MEKAYVRGCFGDGLAIELEHESEHAMRRRMRRPHVENHFLADVVIGFAQPRLLRGNSRHWIGRLNLADGECHRFVLSSVEWIDNSFTLANAKIRCKLKVDG